jgi:hypothetical protein
VKEVWVVALKARGNVGILGGKSERAKTGEPNDSFCVFASRGSAKRFVRIGQEQFDFLSTVMRGEPAEDVEYIQLRPDAVTTFAKEFGLPYVMPSPTPQRSLQGPLVETVPVEDFAASL